MASSGPSKLGKPTAKQRAQEMRERPIQIDRLVDNLEYHARFLQSTSDTRVHADAFAELQDKIKVLVLETITLSNKKDGKHYIENLLQQYTVGWNTRISNKIDLTPYVINIYKKHIDMLENALKLLKTRQIQPLIMSALGVAIADSYEALACVTPASSFEKAVFYCNASLDWLEKASLYCTDGRFTLDDVVFKKPLMFYLKDYRKKYLQTYYRLAFNAAITTKDYPLAVEYLKKYFHYAIFYTGHPMLKMIKGIDILCDNGYSHEMIGSIDIFLSHIEKMLPLYVDVIQVEINLHKQKLVESNKKACKTVTEQMEKILNESEVFLKECNPKWSAKAGTLAITFNDEDAAVITSGMCVLMKWDATESTCTFNYFKHKPEAVLKEIQSLAKKINAEKAELAEQEVLDELSAEQTVDNLTNTLNILKVDDGKVELPVNEPVVEKQPSKKQLKQRRRQIEKENTESSNQNTSSVVRASVAQAQPTALTAASLGFTNTQYANFTVVPMSGELLIDGTYYAVMNVDESNLKVKVAEVLPMYKKMFQKPTLEVVGRKQTGARLVSKMESGEDEKSFKLAITKKDVRIKGHEIDFKNNKHLIVFDQPIPKHKSKKNN